MKKASTFPSEKEEKKLFKELQLARKEKKSVNEKILTSKIKKCYTPLVSKVVRPMAHTEAEALDFRRWGLKGLAEAAKRYDLGRKYRFMTYAIWWIRQSILKKGIGGE